MAVLQPSSWGPRTIFSLYVSFVVQITIVRRGCIFIVYAHDESDSSAAQTNGTARRDRFVRKKYRPARNRTYAHTSRVQENGMIRGRRDQVTLSQIRCTGRLVSFWWKPAKRIRNSHRLSDSSLRGYNNYSLPACLHSRVSKPWKLPNRHSPESVDSISESTRLEGGRFC